MGEMGNVRCITIIHPLHEIKNYRMYAAFFRLLGIFVCEKTTGEKIDDLGDWLFEIYHNETSGEYTEPLPVIQKMVNDRVIDEEMGQILQKAFDIFFEEDLMRAGYSAAYFSNARNAYVYKRMYHAYNQFEQALKKFEKLENTLWDPKKQKYIWAAKSNCKRRMNELYHTIWNAIQAGWYGKDEIERQELKQKLWEKKFYSYEEINEDIQKILNYDCKFYGAYVIRGFASEIDPEHRFDSVSDLLEAVKLTGRHSYASYVYYRIGKYCEVIRGNLSTKWEYYRIALELDPKNYRALYKLILKEKAEGRAESAGDLCAKLIAVLNVKEESCSLQPVECAYLFKTYTIWGSICCSLGEFIKGIEHYKHAEKVYQNNQNEDPENGFYPWMFGKDWEDESDAEREGVEAPWKIYKAAARAKLKIQNLYKLIAHAAEDAGIKDIYEYYYPKSLDVDYYENGRIKES